MVEPGLDIASMQYSCENPCEIPIWNGSICRNTLLRNFYCYCCYWRKNVKWTLKTTPNIMKAPRTPTNKTQKNFTNPRRRMTSWNNFGLLWKYCCCWLASTLCFFPQKFSKDSTKLTRVFPHKTHETEKYFRLIPTDSEIPKFGWNSQQMGYASHQEYLLQISSNFLPQLLEFPL